MAIQSAMEQEKLSNSIEISRHRNIEDYKQTLDLSEEIALTLLGFWYRQPQQVVHCEDDTINGNSEHDGGV